MPMISSPPPAGTAPAGTAGRAGDGQGPGPGVRGRDTGRDIGVSLRRYVHVRSRWDTDIGNRDEGYPGELAALADHVPVDPRGRPHLGEPARRRPPRRRMPPPAGGRPPPRPVPRDPPRPPAPP